MRRPSCRLPLVEVAAYGPLGDGAPAPRALRRTPPVDGLRDEPQQLAVVDIRSLAETDALGTFVRAPNRRIAALVWWPVLDFIDEVGYVYINDG